MHPHGLHYANRRRQGEDRPDEYVLTGRGCPLKNGKFVLLGYTAGEKGRFQFTSI
jgi:hypothetical protein